MNLPEKKREEILRKLLENKLKNEQLNNNFSNLPSAFKPKNSSLNPILEGKRNYPKIYAWILGITGAAILALGVHTGSKFYQMEVLAQKHKTQIEHKERLIQRQALLLETLQQRADSLEKLLLHSPSNNVSENIHTNLEQLQAELAQERSNRQLSEEKMRYYEEKIKAYEELLVRKDELIVEYGKENQDTQTPVNQNPVSLSQ